jgi:hypothetical protein
MSKIVKFWLQVLMLILPPMASWDLSSTPADLNHTSTLRSLKDLQYTNETPLQHVDTLQQGNTVHHNGVICTDMTYQVSVTLVPRLVV